MPKPDHKARKHAQWSASATHRNWLCPGNIALAEDLTKPPESKPAAWGTACHQVAEISMLSPPIDIGDTIETERHVFYVDQEMLDCANVYIDYIHAQGTQGFTILAIEKEFALDGMGLPIPIGGTADAVLYNDKEKLLEIVDLKTGKGHAVEAINNPQERLYALGVVTNMDLRQTPVNQVQTTIVQPRLPHKDGTIRSERLHVADLMDWTIDLVPRVVRAGEALKAYVKARDNTVTMDDWVTEYLNPGEEQCTFCPAAGGCPALRRNALAIAGAWQDDSGEFHFKSNLFKDNSLEAIEADLDMFEFMEAWIRERRALAHELASLGHRFEHWNLVEKIGHRKFIGANETEIIANLRARIDLRDDQLFDRKLKSPAGLEKAIGRKTVEEMFSDLIIKPITGTDLIRSSNTVRTVAPTIIDRLFKE